MKQLKGFIHAFSRWEPKDGPPTANLLPAAVRRRTSRVTKMVAEVAARVAERSSLAIDSVAIVHGSAFGELATTVELLRMLHVDDGALSPMRFSGSVHNTPLGYLSIGTANRAPSTTVAAGSHTVAMTLVEALAQLPVQREILVVVADEGVPSPLSDDVDDVASAAAFHLSLREAGALAAIELSRESPPLNDRERAGILAAQGSARHPMRPALELLDALTRARKTVIPLAPEPAQLRLRLVPLPP